MNRPIFPVGEESIGYFETVSWFHMVGDITEREFMAFPSENGCLGSSQGITPASAVEGGLKVGSVKLSVTEEDHIGVFGDELLDFLYQLHVHFLGEVPLFTFRHGPGNGQCTLLVDQTNHEGHAVASHSASVDHQGERFTRGGRE